MIETSIKKLRDPFILVENGIYYAYGTGVPDMTDWNDTVYACFKNESGKLDGEWTRLLRSHVRPHLFLAGHTHKVDVVYPADPADHHGLPCPLAVASAPTPDGFVGGKLTLGKNALTLTYNDHIGNPEGVFMFEKE